MPLSARAALYLPGETLDPACAPTDSNCGISTIVASSTANSIPYYAANGSVLSATSTFQLLANGTASTTNLIVTTSLTLGTLSGFLKATAGAIAASLINLASDVTGILPIGSGGTGWGAIQASAIPYGNGTSALATTTAGTAGYVLAYLNGVPTWTATSSINNGITAVTGTWPIISSGGATPAISWGGIATSSSISAASGLLYATGVNTLASISTSTAVSMSITGLAGTATALATPRAINGVNFDGTANIVVASTTLLGDTNTFSGTNTFSTLPVLGSLTGLVAGNSGALYQVASSSLFGFTPASNAVTITGAYPLTGGGDLTANRIFSLAFGTTTSNTWANTQTFTNPIVIGSLAGLVGASSGTTYAVSTSTLNIGGTASNITGIAALANGGTGLSSITGNRLLYSNANGTALLEVATSTLSIGGNAATVTTNANLTGVVTSTGNATVFGTQNAGVLGVAANGSLTAPMATSTLYGTGVGGQVLGWSNTANGLAFIATSTDITGFTTGTLSVARGGTGVATLTSSQLLYGNGTGNVASVATTSLTLSGFPANIPAGYGKLVGGSDTTFTWWGLATTSQPASSNLLVSNGTSGVYGVGTTSATCSTGVSCTGFAVLGGSNPSFALAALGSAGVLGAQTATTPTVQATSTLYGTGIGGQVLGWSNTANGLAFIATSTDITGFTTGTLSVARGGTGVSTLSTSQLLYGNGTGNVASVATTTLTLSGFPANIPAGYGKLVGGSDTTFTYWGLATTSQPASSNLLVSNGTSGVYGVGTTSATCSTGVSCTGFAVLGASNPSFALAALGSAGVLGAQTATTPTVQATSTLYGTGVGGQVLGWSNTANGLAFIATSTDITGFTTGTLSVARGGTGVSTLTTAQLLYGNGTGNVASVATTTLTLSGFPANIPAGYGKLVGGSDTTFTWWGLATTSQPSSSNLLVSNGTSGVYGVATTSATCSTGVSCTGFNVLGGSNPSFALAALGSAGVFGAQTATTPSVQATSTLYGTGVGGQVLGWNNNTNGIAWVATSTSGGGTPGGSLGQLQWNSNSTFAGVSTSTLTATGMLSISNSPAIIGSSGAVVTLPLTKGNFIVGDDAGVAQATSTIFISSTGFLGIGTTSPSQALSVQGNGLFSGNITLANLTATGTITSNITTGTAPLAVNSTTKVANLNADLLDGLDSSAFGDATAANQTTILSRIGTNADATTTPAAASSIFSGMKFLAQRQYKMQTFTSSGTWTWPGSHVATVWVTMAGGGGTGGTGGTTSGNSLAGGGGGGGAGQVYIQYPVAVSGNVTVTINGAGATTVFGSLTAAAGSNGGNGSAAGIGAGGAGGGGAGGGAAANSLVSSATVAGSSGSGTNAGGGGNSSGSGGGGGGGGGTPFGFGGKGGNVGATGAAAAANTGAGGGGGGGGGNAGGAGGSGIVIVEWFE